MSKAEKGPEQRQETKGGKTRSQRPRLSSPPPPSAASLRTSEGRCGEAIRLYLQLDRGELESQEVTRRVSVLQNIHNMASAELEKRVQELEKRLVEAGKLPRKVLHVHE